MLLHFDTDLQTTSLLFSPDQNPIMSRNTFINSLSSWKVPEVLTITSLFECCTLLHALSHHLSWFREDLPHILGHLQNFRKKIVNMTLPTDPDALENLRQLIVLMGQLETSATLLHMKLKN